MMAIYKDLGTDVWHCILFLLSSFDLLNLFGASSFFLNLIRNPLFLIAHHDQHHKFTHSNDLLVVKKPSYVNLFSKSKEETLITAAAELEIFGTFKGTIGLYSKHSRKIALYNPYMESYTGIFLPSPSPNQTQKLIAMFYHNRRYQLMVCFQDIGMIYDPVSPHKGGEWQNISELPVYLNYIPQITPPHPTAIVTDTPFWSYYNPKESCYESFMFNGHFSLLPSFKKEGAVFVSLKDLYASLILNKSTSTLDVYVLKEAAQWEKRYTIMPQGFSGGKLAQIFVLGDNFVRHDAGRVKIFSTERNRTWAVQGQPGHISTIYNYTPSMLMFKPNIKACWKGAKYPMKLIEDLGL